MIRIVRDGGAARVDVDDVEKLEINAAGGADKITVHNLSGTDVQEATISLESEPGAGTGDNQSDSIVLDGTDGADNVELKGSASVCTLTGLPVSVKVLGSDRVRLIADGGGAALDFGDVETINISVLGGSDTLNILDMTGTDLTQINVNLAADPGATNGDGQVDSVVVEGGPYDRVVQISGAGGSVEVMGLSATIDLASAQGSTDLLRVNMGIGADAVLADGLSAGSVRLYLDGGAGDDVVYGSPGDDVLDGGPGDDILNGRFGFDVGMNGEVLFDIEAVVP
jgi:hypothetical protein